MSVEPAAAQPVRFQIYQETGLTPVPATRTAAVINHGFPSHGLKKTIDDKENQSVAASTADVHRPADDEPMAVDFVNMLLVS